MAGNVAGRTVDSTLGRGAVVFAVLVVQSVAFVLAQAAGFPTLYALFALGSAATLAAAAGDGRGAVAGAVPGAVVGTGIVVGIAVAVDLFAGAVLAPVVLAGVVALTGDRRAWVGAGAAALGALLLVAVGVPLLLFVVRQDPALVREAALSPEVQRTLYLSVYAPLLAALAALVTGVPLAYLLARGFAGQAFVESLVDLPLVVPHSVAGIVVLFGFGPGGAFPELSVLGTMAGMILALLFVSAPFAVNASREAFEAVDPRLEYAARSHGAGPLGTFRRVSLPLASRGVVTGGVLAWARAVSEFGAVAVVAYSVRFFYPGAGAVTAQHAPVYVYNTYITESLAQSGAVAVLLLGLSAVLFLAVRVLAYDEGGPL